MLTTDDRNQLRLTPHDESSGTTVWRAVSFELGVPYVFFTYSLGLDPSGTFNTLVLWTEEDVIEFCQSFLVEGSRKIFDISLLILNFVDDKPFREMVRLRELWSLKLPNSDGCYPIYIDLNGQRVGQIRDGDCGQIEKNAELLYKLHGSGEQNMTFF